MILPVAVVIPTHNSEKTIGRALKSVLDQEQLPSEILVIDDCSSDSTVQLVSNTTTPPGVSLKIMQLATNEGPAAARNHGWDATTSEFIAFLDSDDSWHKAKLAIQTRVMRSNPEIEISGHLTGESIPIDLLIEPQTRLFSLRKFLIRNRVSTPTVMVRRTVVDRFDSSFWYAEDYELWLRHLTQHTGILRIELPLAHLHKAEFGESGLSARLYQMYRGELQAVVKLRTSGRLSHLYSWLTMSWMALKFVLRLIRTRIRQLK